MSDNASEEKNYSFRSDKVSRDTLFYVNKIIREMDLYPDILEALRRGEASLEVRKRVMLRAIDEAWIVAIEDTIHSLDMITRRPTRFIEEQEEVLPIELTNKVSERSIKHLSQHTDYISDVNEDDEIIPSKLLNVFREDSIMTYENKFINTLINRLYTFVRLRYDSALASGEDVKNTSMEFKDTFEHGAVHGKIHISIELEEKPKPDEVEKNYVFVSDLWRRVEKIRKICGDYANSNFAKMMGNNYIRPPVLRTNAILKNRDFRQCLALWEFISSYENVGYTTMVFDTLLELSEKQIHDLYELTAMQYLVFRNHVEKGFDEDQELAKASTEEPLKPDVIDDLSPAAVSEFNLHIAKINESIGVRTLEEIDILKALEVALLADELWRRREELEERDRSNRSFTAGLTLAQEPAQTFYTEIKNFLLSYRKVKSRVSWKHDSFNYGREIVTWITVRGKTLNVYLPLDPTAEEYEPYATYITDMSELTRYEKLPFGFKVRSRRALGIVLKLIAGVLDKLGAKKLPEPPTEDYHLPYRTRGQLITKGLIRVKRIIQRVPMKDEYSGLFDDDNDGSELW